MTLEQWGRLLEGKMMKRTFRTAMIRRLKFLFGLATLLFPTAGTLFAACTASEKNADYSAVGSGTSSSVTANVNAVGDLVAITAWCYPSCTPTSVKLGSQTAFKTTVSGNPGPGSPGEGQGFIYYVLSSTAAGAQTITFTASGGAAQTQVSYIDFTPTAGCTFSHDIDSPVGSSAGISTDFNPGTINAPSITPTAGDLLFNFTWTSEHVNSVNSPWSCPIYSGAGETQTCEFVNTINAAAYILSAPSGSTANNMTDIHNSDSWQGLIASFSLSGSSSGTGNACPSTAPVTGNHCYFIAANGSDANSGASESSPWLHAPGMPNCTANCAAHKPAPGEGFILRGGDTWHFGNSSLSPYTGGTWTFGWSGSSGNTIYFGVDPNWFSGGAWARPILNGDNAINSSTTLGACAHQTGPNNIMLDVTLLSFITVDNFEFVGSCNNSAGNPYGKDILVNNNSSHDNLYSNLYFHGWSHQQFTPPCDCANLHVFGGSNGSGSEANVVYQGIVIDGSDSDPEGMSAFYEGMYDIHNSVFRYVAQGIAKFNHTLHDTWFDHWYAVGDGNSHSNVYESTGEPAASGAYYNNLFTNIYTAGTFTSGQVIIWPWTTPGYTDYWFNNVFSKVNNQPFNLGQNGSAQGTITVFNNTIQISDGSSANGCGSTQPTAINMVNNHYIADGAAYNSNCSGHAITKLTEDLMTNAAATSAGYTSAQPFAYSPTAANSPTVGTGTNVQSYCTAMAAAGLTDAANACQSDTRYACTYNSSNHTVNCPARTVVPRPSSTAWNIGSYQYSGSQASAPNPPSGLVATVQ